MSLPSHIPLTPPPHTTPHHQPYNSRSLSRTRRRFLSGGCWRIELCCSANPSRVWQLVGYYWHCTLDVCRKHVLPRRVANQWWGGGKGNMEGVFGDYDSMLGWFTGKTCYANSSAFRRFFFTFTENGSRFKLDSSEKVNVMFKIRQSYKEFKIDNYCYYSSFNYDHIVKTFKFYLN